VGILRGGVPDGALVPSGAGVEAATRAETREAEGLVGPRGQDRSDRVPPVAQAGALRRPALSQRLKPMRRDRPAHGYVDAIRRTPKEERRRRRPMTDS